MFRHELKCPVYRDYLERTITNMAGDEPKYVRFLAEPGREAWLDERDFEPIKLRINLQRRNQVVIPGEMFLRLCRYMDEEKTEKILKENKRTQEIRRRDIQRISNALEMNDCRDILTKVG